MGQQSSLKYLLCCCYLKMTFSLILFKNFAFNPIHSINFPGNGSWWSHGHAMDQQQRVPDLTPSNYLNHITCEKTKIVSFKTWSNLDPRSGVSKLFVLHYTTQARQKTNKVNGIMVGCLEGFGFKSRYYNLTGRTLTILNWKKLFYFLHLGSQLKSLIIKHLVNV